MLTNNQRTRLTPNTGVSTISTSTHMSTYLQTPHASYSALREYVHDAVVDPHVEHVELDRRLHEPAVRGVFWCADHGYVDPLPGTFDCPYDMPYDPSVDERPAVRCMVQLNPS